MKNRIVEEGLSEELSRLEEGGRRNRGNRPRVPLEDVLVEGSNYNRYYLKRRLIQAGLVDNVCAVCKCQPEWRGKPLLLVLDHINGVRDDNRIENIRLLCPNCDSQSPTYCGRNKKPGKLMANC